eukprot:4509753-Heterocapsa_arctica.AAC.1
MVITRNNEDVRIRKRNRKRSEQQTKTIKNYLLGLAPVLELKEKAGRLPPPLFYVLEGKPR